MSNVKKLEFAEGTDVGAPTDLGIQTSTTSINEYPDDAAFVSANGSAEDGDTYLNTTTRKIRYYLNSAWRNAVPESDSADPTKKVEFDLTGATTGTTATFDINNTVSRTYTMQDETGTIPVLPIVLTSEVSGALPIANGGTGQTGATAAFDALAPTTTTGDLIYHNGTDNVRLGIGSEGQQLKVTSGVPAWGDAGGGSGEKNYVENPSAASAITGWNQVGDLDVAPTTTPSELPREHTTGSGIKITADSNVQSTADYVYYDFTLDDVDLSKKLKIQWSQKVTGTYSAGQLAVIITTQADRTTALHTPVTTAIPAADGEFITSFDAGTTATLSLVIRATTDMTTDGGIVISDVVVGPGVITQGAVVSEWQDYTDAVTNGGSATFSYTGRQWRRVGDSLEGIYSFTVTGNGSGSSAVTIPLPNSLTANETNLTEPAYGFWEFYSGSTFSYGGKVTLNGSGGVTLNEAGTATSIVGSELATNERYHIRFTVRIAQWAGSGTVNLAANSVTYGADDGSSDVFGPNGALVPNVAYATGTTSRTFTFPYTPSDTAVATLQIKLTTSRSWQNASDIYPYFSGNNSNSNNYYGVRGQFTSATTYEVEFGNRGVRVSASNVDNGAASWADAFTGGTRFRVVLSESGQAVGFGAANGTSAGLLPPVTSMGGALATQLGFKQYVIGTAYTNGTPTLSSTPSGWSMTRGVLIPKQMSDGIWRLQIQLRGTWTSSATASFTLSGVTARNTGSLNQAMSAAPQTTTAGSYGVWSPGGGSFSFNSEASQAGGALWGEIELESKPTWAD